MVVCIGSIAVLALIVGAGAAWACLRGANGVGLCVIALFAASENFHLNVVSGLEWGWVLLFAAAYLSVFLRGDALDDPRAARWLAAVAFLGSLARTDFGLLPAGVFAAALLESWRFGGRGVLLRPAAGLAGASIGVVASLLRNRLVGDQFLQSSARMKSLWAQHYALDPDRLLTKVSTLFGAPSLVTELLALLALVCALAFGIRRFVVSADRSGAPDPGLGSGETELRVAWLGSLFALSGYVVFYLQSVPVQPWYTANLIVPLALLLGLPAQGRSVWSPASISIAVPLLVLLGLQAAPASRFLEKPKWQHHRALHRAGTLLREKELEDVGAWNAGIVGYYQGGRVVNLDGLVNDEIYEYAANNQLPRYIDERGLRYVIDFRRIFEAPLRRRRGGFDDPAFLARLVPIQPFQRRQSGRMWTGLTLYRLRAPEEERPEPVAEPDPTRP